MSFLTSNFQSRSWSWRGKHRRSPNAWRYWWVASTWNDGSMTWAGMRLLTGWGSELWRRAQCLAASDQCRRVESHIGEDGLVVTLGCILPLLVGGRSLMSAVVAQWYSLVISTRHNSVVFVSYINKGRSPRRARSGRCCRNCYVLWLV